MSFDTNIYFRRNAGISSAQALPVFDEIYIAQFEQEDEDTDKDTDSDSENTSSKSTETTNNGHPGKYNENKEEEEEVVSKYLILFYLEYEAVLLQYPAGRKRSMPGTLKPNK